MATCMHEGLQGTGHNDGYKYILVVGSLCSDFGSFAILSLDY